MAAAWLAKTKKALEGRWLGSGCWLPLRNQEIILPLMGSLLYDQSRYQGGCSKQTKQQMPPLESAEIEQDQQNQGVREAQYIKSFRGQAVVELQS